MRRISAVINSRAGEHLAAALCLRHEHIQSARTRNAERLRLQQQRRARGVIHHVEHERTLRELPQVDGGLAGVRIHTDGCGVDDHAAHRRDARDSRSYPRRVAGDDRHARAKLREHGLNGRGRAAVSEHERLLARRRPHRCGAQGIQSRRHRHCRRRACRPAGGRARSRCRAFARSARARRSTG